MKRFTKNIKIIFNDTTVCFGFFVSSLSLCFYFCDTEFLFLKDFGKSFFNVFLFSFILPVILVLFSERKHIEHQLEIIDDFKKWGDEKEGQLRIAGAIRRLNKKGKFDIDFKGINLKNFDFAKSDIENISGSNFMGSRRIGDIGGSKSKTELSDVSFSNINCSNVIFCKAGNLGILFFEGKNLDFYNANLTNANFSGACLEWDNSIADKKDWYDYDEDEEGNRLSILKYWPAFYEADLTNTSFKDANFEKVDFREAKNILLADFKGAKGLETCFFDDGIKEKLLSKIKT